VGFAYLGIWVVICVALTIWTPYVGGILLAVTGLFTVLAFRKARKIDIMARNRGPIPFDLFLEKLLPETFDPELALIVWEEVQFLLPEFNGGPFPLDPDDALETLFGIDPDDVEMGLFVHVCERWGLSQSDADCKANPNSAYPLTPRSMIRFFSTQPALQGQERHQNVSRAKHSAVQKV